MTRLRLIDNPPGLAAIDCRIGTHALLRRQLLDGLATRPGLARLTTRSDQDFSIALLDAWACAADVVTFYSERLAHESYLGTATERLSVRHLARLVGYELDPGVAAETALAFSVDPIISRGAPVLAEPGLQVQSVPGPGQTPQTFETTEALELRPAWNDLRPAPTAPRAPTPRNMLLGATVDDLTILGQSDARAPLVLVAAADPGDYRILRDYSAADANGSLRVTWIDEVAPPPNPRVYALRRQSAPVLDNHNLIFNGENALATNPPWIVLAEGDRAELYARTFANVQGNTVVQLGIDDAVTPSRRPLTAFTAAAQVHYAEQELAVQVAPAADPTRLSLLGAQPPVSLGDAVLLVADADPQHWRFAVVHAAEPDRERGLSTVTLGPLLPRWQSPLRGPFRVYALRQRAALFGHNAPDPRLTAATLNSPAFEWNNNVIVGWAGFDAPDGPIDLDAATPAAPGAPLLLVRGDAVERYTIGQVQTVSRVGFGLSARISRISPLAQPGAARERFVRRETEVFLGPELLALADLPDDHDVDGDTLTLAGAHALPPARLLIVTGTTVDGAREAELVAVREAAIAGERTTVAIDPPLRGRYRRATVVVRGNVARASHGERIDETLGGGDPTRPFQSFPLRAGPLTHVRSEEAAGRASTLELRVDGQRWREVATLVGSGPHDRVFTVRADESGTSRVQFGDGTHGARLPAGRDNVRVTYRRGTGLSGQVPADAITTPRGLPLGVQGVRNPLPARGAADPEGLATARRRAPGSVRTLDRVVSLSDYADYARGFPGVARAHAAAFGDALELHRLGLTRAVVLTIAGPGGAEILPDDPIWTGLRAALRAAGDPFVLLQVRTFKAASFLVEGTIERDRSVPAATLRPAVLAALHARFDFEARDFGQPVYRSEVLAAIQAVPGVLGVDLDVLRRSDTPDPPLRDRLIAALPNTPDGHPEVLTLDFTNLLTPPATAKLRVIP